MSPDRKCFTHSRGDVMRRPLFLLACCTFAGPVPASAQLCMGGASLSDAPAQLGAGVAFSVKSRAFQVNAAGVDVSSLLRDSSIESVTTPIKTRRRSEPDWAGICQSLINLHVPKC
jgi:hypothetical protein